MADSVAAHRRPRFSVALANQNIEWDHYLAAVKAADELAFETFWTFDHLMTIGGDPDGSCFESYTTMAAFAQATRRIRIGALVTGAAYRNAAMQLKLATQIDVISGGRFDFGIGAGWAEREFRAFNLPFASPKERVGKLRETVELAKELWTGDPHKKVTYEGEYVQAYDLFLNPQPVQRPRPPILIGGGGEQLTLRVVARHADIWHGFGDLETLAHKNELIDTYAKRYDRDPQEIARSTTIGIWVGEPPATLVQRLGDRGSRGLVSGTPEAIESRLRPYVQQGITYFILSLVGGYSPEGLDNWRRVSEQILPRFQD